MLGAVRVHGQRFFIEGAIMETIKNNSEVLIHFVMSLADGSVAESTKAQDKPMLFRMGDGSLSAGFEQALLGLKEGEKATFTLIPEDAFGQPNPDNIHHFDRSRFGEEAPAEVGNIIAFTGPDGQDIPALITEVSGESVTIDFNHPLAGKDVTFAVDIVSIKQ